MSCKKGVDAAENLPVKICWHMHVISTPCHEYRSARTSSSPTLAPPMFTLYVLPSEAPVFPVHSQKPTQLLSMKSASHDL